MRVSRISGPLIVLALVGCWRTLSGETPAAPQRTTEDMAAALGGDPPVIQVVVGNGWARIHQLERQAAQARKTGRNDEAIVQYRELLAEVENAEVSLGQNVASSLKIQTLWRIAACYEDKKDGNSAVGMYRQIAALGKTASLYDAVGLASFRLATHAMAVGKPQARVVYQEAAAEIAGNDRWLLSLASLYDRYGVTDQAIEGYQAILARHPVSLDLDELRLALGSAYEDVGDYDRSREVLHQIPTSSRHYALARYHLAFTFLFPGHRLEAIEEFQEALKSGLPRSSAGNALYYVADSYYVIGDYAAAKATYRNTVESADPESWEARQAMVQLDIMERLGL